MDGDENLPKATVSSFVKENLEGMKCSNEFIDFILKVSREYISVIADEANKICLQEGKKTIAPYYVYEALKRHQLDSQIEELEEAKQKFTDENHKAQNDIFKNPEMLRMLSQQQERLFEKSRNQTEAQIIGLDKIQSGEDYMKTGLHEITKLQSSEDSQGLGAQSNPTKEISQNKNDNFEDGEEEDYEE